MTQTQTSASAVSRVLRKGGLNPLGSGAPRSREGVRVSGSFRAVRVEVDLDSERQAAIVRADAEAILVDAGYDVEQTGAFALYARRGSR